MMLPTIAPIAVPSSLGELAVDVGPARVELEVVDVWVREPIEDDPVDVTDDAEVWDDRSNDEVDEVGDKVEEGGVVRVEGVAFDEVGEGETGGVLSVLGGVEPP